MAKIMLEVQARGLNQYHSLESFPVTIGRGLDNDIILSDGSISAHHVRLEKNAEGQIELYNLSQENGTRINGQLVKQSPIPLTLPAQLLVGNRAIRLLSSDMSVESTHMSRCTGWFKLLCHPASAILLFLITLLVLVTNEYLGTTLQKEPLYYISNLLLKLLFLLAGFLILTVLARVFTNRWQLAPILSLVSLFGLVPLALESLGHWLDYFLTSDTPSMWLVTGLGGFLLLPVLIFIYLRWVMHQQLWPALGITLLLSALPLGVKSMSVLDQISANSEFSALPSYNQSLSSFNIHKNIPLPLNDFMRKVTETLPSQIADDN